MVLSPAPQRRFSPISASKAKAPRVQWLDSWTSAPIDGHGKHTLQLGTVLAHAEDPGEVLDRDVHLVNA